MSELPKLTAKEIIAMIEKAGFAFSRQSGSHKIYKNHKGIRITVPLHGNKVLHPKIIKSILRDSDCVIGRNIKTQNNLKKQKI